MARTREYGFARRRHGEKAGPLAGAKPHPDLVVESPPGPTRYTVYHMPYTMVVILSFLKPSFPCCRFRLQNPSAAYAPVFAPIQRKVDLCLRAASALAISPTVNLAGAVATLLHPGQQPGTSQMMYSVDILKQESPFLAPQLAAWVKARQCTQYYERCILSSVAGS